MENESWFWRFENEDVVLESDAVTIRISKKIIKSIADELNRLGGVKKIHTDKGVFIIKKWFYEQYPHTLEKLDKCKVERETDRAILFVNEKTRLWIPKSVITKEAEK